MGSNQRRLSRWFTVRPYYWDTLRKCLLSGRSRVPVDAHGFIEWGGRFTAIDDPHAGTVSGQGTSVGYINDAGQITGSYNESDNDTVAFAGPAGRYTTTRGCGFRLGESLLVEVKQVPGGHQVGSVSVHDG